MKQKVTMVVARATKKRITRDRDRDRDRAKEIGRGIGRW